MAKAVPASFVRAKVPATATRVAAYLSFVGEEKRFFPVMERIAQAAHMAESLKTAGPLPLPTEIKRWTVLRAPFTKKKSRETMELRRHKRLLVVESDQDNIRRFLSFVNDAWEPSIAHKVTLHKYFPLDHFVSRKQSTTVGQTAAAASTTTRD
eukprot:TRINITY_DN15830_c0_g1_i1.p1 TRINITY_DN15830_c0_g1~~TRINITY_DN15830_c0_g1_i1.p1  ORF type:complete len:173 (-),score=31.74 TRINITY_DN15830_c0_g1_i1:86-544(-)